MTDPIATGIMPEVVFPLLAALRDRAPIEAERISDRYMLVLQGIKEDEIKDWQMVGGLLETVAEAFNRVAPEGFVFVRHGLAFGYEPLDHR